MIGNVEGYIIHLARLEGVYARELPVLRLSKVPGAVSLELLPVAVDHHGNVHVIVQLKS